MGPFGLPPRMGNTMWSSLIVSRRQVIGRSMETGLLLYVTRKCIGSGVDAGKAWLMRSAMVVLSRKG